MEVIDDVLDRINRTTSHSDDGKLIGRDNRHLGIFNQPAENFDSMQVLFWHHIGRRKSILFCAADSSPGWFTKRLSDH